MLYNTLHYSVYDKSIVKEYDSYITQKKSLEKKEEVFHEKGKK
jgi:hypothetical protein